MEISTSLLLYHLLVVVLEDIRDVTDLLFIKPLGELLLSLFDDGWINVGPHLLQHIDKYGEVVGKTCNGDSIRYDIQWTDHITQGTDDDGLVSLADSIALKRIIKDQGGIHQLRTRSLGNAGDLFYKFRL